MVYLKLVGYASGDTTHIIPAKRVSWNKYVVTTDEEFTQVTDDFTLDDTEVWYPYVFRTPGVGDVGGFTPVFIIDYRDEDNIFKQIVITEGVAFVMSDTGKTIDRVR